MKSRRLRSTKLSVKYKARHEPKLFILLLSRLFLISIVVASFYFFNSWVSSKYTAKVEAAPTANFACLGCKPLNLPFFP